MHQTTTVDCKGYLGLALEDLDGEVVDHLHYVDQGAGADTLAVVSFLQKASETYRRTKKQLMRDPCCPPAL